MTVRLLSCFVLLLVAFSGFAQKTSAEIQADYRAAYNKRISKEYINRVYIPSDLADAFNQLNGLIDSESKKKFLSKDENEAARKLHFSLGRWIIHNWGFYDGSRLSHYLKNLGLTYPDDMARFIIITYHRNLAKAKLEVKPLIDSMTQKREVEHQERLKQGKVIFEDKYKVERIDTLKNN